MLKIWGRNTSSNVQKVMWAIGEMDLPCERIDVGGPFGKTKEAPYLAMNPNALVPTLEEQDGFTLWESNSIVRYLAAKQASPVLEPAELRTRALAQKWMDWQLSVMGPALTPVFWNLIRTPPEKRDANAIAAGKEKSIAAAQLLDGQLSKTAYVAGDAFSYGDIPVGVMTYRYMRLIPERPPTPHLDRWYKAISSRAPFEQHITAIPFV
ncbi:MAG: glutathione S-transferase family protein [Hyphomicrobiales bacterium]|nr:glutathione S-transferase family protein [Hyphomicrobiales bacterium]